MYLYDQTTGPTGFSATLMQEAWGMPIVSVFGEIDLYTVHDLDILMMRAVSEAGEGGTVVVDLEGVEFMDATGLEVLISGRSVLENSGGSVAVVCGRRIERLFEITGLTEDFELHPDLGSAVEGSSTARWVS